MKLSIKKTIIGIISICLVANLGATTYINPIISSDYSDPDALRVGGDYFLTASSFANTPGLPILHSRDLINWEIINHAIDAVPPYEYYNSEPRHGKGVWAPSIRCFDGIYYIYWGDPDFGIYMVKTDNPYGKWSEPVLVKEGKGMIDPVPFRDDDGKMYLAYAWAASRIGFNSVITISELNKDGTKLISQPIMVYDGNDGVNHTVEGPKLYKRNGYYYIFAPAGGVAQGWQLVLRAKNVYGPYESRIVMMQGNTDINGPHQGALVDTPDGESWFLHFQDRGVYGRVLHLNPVKWIDDWPLIGKDNGNEAGEPYRTYKMPFKDTKQIKTYTINDRFESIGLNPRWEWSANYSDWFGFGTASGFYRLNSAILPDSTSNLWSVPNLLLQKFPGNSFTVTTKINFNCKDVSTGFIGGLLLFGYDYGYIGVKMVNNSFQLIQAYCKDSDKGNNEVSNTFPIELPTKKYDAGLQQNMSVTIFLRAEISNGGNTRFSYSLDGKKYNHLGIDFQSREGKWVGAKVGVFSTVPNGTERGWLNIEKFDITDIK